MSVKARAAEAAGILDVEFAYSSVGTPLAEPPKGDFSALRVHNLRARRGCDWTNHENRAPVE